jgi:quercetin dioxygenase-like cupin family protein
MPKPTAKVIHYTEVPAAPAGTGAPGATIRTIIDEEHDGAPVFSLRVIEVAPGGHTPDHTHPFEHENYILEGTGRVRIEESWHDLRPGDVVFVPPGIPHTYQNAGDEPFRFICGIPVKGLQQKE